jgi:cardiolipin synthase (CMP-forming)
MAIATSGRPRGLPGAVARVACYALAATWQNTPNLLTLARIACIPLILLLLAEGEHASAFYVFLAAAVSDALDGFLAKRFTGVTAVGTILDPVADKLLMTTLLGALALLAVLPAWLFVLTLARDLLIVAGVLALRAAAAPGFKVSPHPVGKLCTFLQLCLGAVALASLSVLPAAAGLLPALALATAALTVASGVLYLVEALRLAQPRPEPR